MTKKRKQVKKVRVSKVGLVNKLKKDKILLEGRNRLMKIVKVSSVRRARRVKK
jgi:hypothetical protein